MPRSSDWFIVVNPASGGGRAGRHWPALARELELAGVGFRSIVTDHPGHAVSLVAEAVCRGFRRLLAVGGDGTLHELVNGALSQQQVPASELLLGAAPLGSGNDWAHTHGIPARPAETALCMAAARRGPHDLGRLDFPEASGTGRSCYFINVAGAGLDAHLLERLPPGVPRRLGYFVGVLRGLAAYAPPEFTIDIDGRRSRARLYLALLAMTPYCGGGMHVAPAARTDDGLLDVVMVSPLKLPRELLKLRRIYDGRLPGERFARHDLGRVIRIDAAPAASVQADGQVVGRTPVVATLLPGAITTLRG
jgi:YegS/Rv2252/BmrU family lipid kinase